MNKNVLFLSSFCASLVGCFDSGKQSSSSVLSDSSQEATSKLAIVEGASVPSDNSCSSGKQGSVAYDAAQNKFFVCNGGQWSVVDLRGAKGDKGEAGSQGVVGSTGSAGANGRDGVDGDGVRLSIKDGSRIVGILVQYVTIEGAGAALIRMPSGQMGYFSVEKGMPVGRPSNVYYTGANCSGDGYTGRIDEAGPHTIGRLYASTTEYNGTYYYQAIAHATGQEVFQSYRSFGTYGERGICYVGGTSSKQLVKVIKTVPSEIIMNYAPLQFTF